MATLWTTSVDVPTVAISPGITTAADFTEQFAAAFACIRISRHGLFPLVPHDVQHVQGVALAHSEVRTKVLPREFAIVGNAMAEARSVINRDEVETLNRAVRAEESVALDLFDSLDSHVLGCAVHVLIISDSSVVVNSKIRMFQKYFGSSESRFSTLDSE
mgnify:CR=1 FL=1